MARHTPTCRAFATPEGCPYGSRCRYSHETQPPRSALAAANQAANAARPNEAAAGRCHFWWTSGECKRGRQCRYEHIDNPNLKNQVEIRREIEKGGDEVKVTEPFPSLGCLDDLTSDTLLVPFRYQSSVKVNDFLQRLRHTKSITRVEQAEELLTAILSSSHQNDRWTMAQRQRLLTAIANDTNILLLLKDILRWPNVTNSGTEIDRLPFQSHWMGLIGFLTSQTVLGTASIMHKNALYALVEGNLDAILETLKVNIDACVAAGSFRDARPPLWPRQKVVGLTSGIQVFAPIITLLLTFFETYRSACISHPEIVDFVRLLEELFVEWSECLEAPDQLVELPSVDRQYLVGKVKTRLKMLVKAVDRVLKPQAAKEIEEEDPNARVQPTADGMIAALERNYDGPGEHSQTGEPRHDNDCADIRDIEIAPTRQELMSRAGTYLPTTIPNAPHHLPADSIDKIVDIQFRLLRSDAIDSLRIGVRSILDELNLSPREFRESQVHRLLDMGGGRYVRRSERDQLMMPVITNIDIVDISTDIKHGVIVEVQGVAPPGGARAGSMSQRSQFWKAGKRLPMGGLVAIVTKEPGQAASVSLAILATMPDKMRDIRDGTTLRIGFGISFINPQDSLRAAGAINGDHDDNETIRILVESPVLYESVRPFLESLQRSDPVLLPMAEYIKHNKQQKKNALPAYSTRPGFQWNLKVLLKENADIDELSLDPSSPSSLAAVRQALHRHGKLDPSQSDAVLDCLTREMALVQGPPGTGKTFTGVELIRLLIDNQVGHVLLLAFTNHALDHILRAIHDSKVTRRLARLGGRSKDEVIAGYSLDMLEKSRAKMDFDRDINRAYKAVKEAENELQEQVERLTTGSADEQHIMDHLLDRFPDLANHLQIPSNWAKHLFNDHRKGGDGWTKVGRTDRSDTLWAFWRNGLDLEHLERLQMAPVGLATPKVQADPIKHAINRFEALSLADSQDNSSGDSHSAKPEEADSATGGGSNQNEMWDLLFAGGRRTYALPSDHGSDNDWDRDDDDDQEASTPPTPLTALPTIHDLQGFLQSFHLAKMPNIPKTDRAIPALLAEGNVWDFSLSERRRIAELVERQAKLEYDAKSIEEFEYLVDKLQDARRGLAEIKDNGFSPKVLVIEEAGQVLEAHVLATLFPSIEHVIAIGDPLQLRPNINCYDLSVEHPRGHDLYRFDVSLMERLSSGGLPMSQLQVQRRMRPAISNIIRHTLYPELEDHDLVQNYPDVQGMYKNVFFFDHMHREAGSDEGLSKSNDFEVQMGCDLALHLLKQGVYNQEGDIVILCAYLGQLMKFRQALAGQVTVLVDERDQREIDKRVDQEEEEEVDTGPRAVNLSQQVLLRTVDNFQGEEAKIVILSLVRNRGDPSQQGPGGPSSIGFLRTKNRINVALSRAKHGMYIMGNKDQLAEKNDMWRRILDDLTENGCVGEGWPIGCHLHPENRYLAERLGVIALKSPVGGCQMPCNKIIDKCGHPCTYACHPGDREHRLLDCHQRCTRLHEPCGHPCEKQCFEACGKCKVLQRNVRLPCGHTADVLCHDMMSLSTVQCRTMVEKQLPTCEHTVHAECSTSVSLLRCNKPCGLARDCCGRNCTAKCSDCQNLNKSVEDLSRPEPALKQDGTLTSVQPTSPKKIERAKHASHKCDKPLDICGHVCSGICSKDHQHVRCTATCVQRCDHTKCKKPCREPCSPCQSHCSWNCEHQKCRMPCCMPCDRPPCNEPCKTILKCGHSCPSVCGEICDQQTCPQCATSAQQEAMVDLLMQATLAEVMSSDPDTRFITLSCRHTFTVETLDGCVGMSEWYDQDGTGRWVTIKEPKKGFVKRPMCPTCRGPVTARRYNRINKRALIDIQEQHAIDNISVQVASLRQAVSTVDADKLSLNVQQAASKLSVGKNVDQADVTRLHRLLASHPSETRCLEPNTFIDEVGNYFGLNPHVAETWRTVNEIPFRLYKQLAKLVNTERLPHVQAYDSAITKVYDEEIKIALSSRLGGDPRDAALLSAKRRVGAPFPQGEARFKIEALLESIKLRLKLVPTAKAFSDRIRPTLAPSDYARLSKAKQREIVNRDITVENFVRLAWALLHSCQRDVRVALNLCNTAQARRLELTALVLALQVDFEDKRFAVQSILASRSKMTQGNREHLADMCLGQRESAAHSTLQGYYRIEGLVQSNRAILEWAKGSILPTINATLQDWHEVALTITRGTFYAPVSAEERMAIVQAVVSAGYGVGGRFYQCPNGHSFTIGECGQAMEESTCPECGERIGGRYHALRADNARDMEMEALATRAGAGRNPHAIDMI